MRRRAEPAILTEASEYEGQQAIRVSCTQLGMAYSATRARRVVDEWVDLLAGTPTSLTALQFVCRTPKRLFAALRGQPQLHHLVVKWGDYDDLTVLEGMRSLRHLELRGATAVTDVRALSSLVRVELLALEGFRHISDLSPLARLPVLTDLELGGAWMTPRNAHVGSLAFLRGLPQLESLLLHTIIVDDLDYTPVLDLPRLKSVRIMATRSMKPSHEDLRRQLPWSG